MSSGDAPSESAQVAERVREARSRGISLRIVGAGHWLDAGRPCTANEPLALDSLRGITEYEPGDLTLSARAGTTLAQIDAATSPEGQWLTLDPFGPRDGTIGATIATASAGPLASAFGTPRDHLLGCVTVSGAGDVVRAGGRVVKNVAGFDLARLMTGAWGTLGVITDVSLRLRARPEVDRTLAVALDAGGAHSSETAWRWLRGSSFTPLAAELCSARLSRVLGLGDFPVLLVRLGGNEPLVRAAERSVAELGTPVTVEPAVWERLRTVEPPGSVVMRMGARPSHVGQLWSAASDATERAGGLAHATLARGIVRCIVPVAAREEENGRLRGIIGELHGSGSRIVERLPASLWETIPSPPMDSLSSGIRRAFDPDGVLNPGIIGPVS